MSMHSKFVGEMAEDLRYMQSEYLQSVRTTTGHLLEETKGDENDSQAIFDVDPALKVGKC